MSNNQQSKPATTPQQGSNQNQQNETFQRGLAQHLRTVQQLAPKPNIQPTPTSKQSDPKPVKKD
jgi:hypothetical protein